jgi:hypothetical protein
MGVTEMKARHTVSFRVAFLLVVGLVVTQIACNAGLSDTQDYGRLVLSFHANRSQAEVGQPVQMQFAVKNTGLGSEVVESKDTPVMDIYVEVVGGGVLLTWSSQNPDKVSHRLEWQPGETKAIELTWIPKQGDVYYGTYRGVYLTGSLSGSSIGGHAAGVRICASDVCR